MWRVLPDRQSAAKKDGKTMMLRNGDGISSVSHSKPNPGIQSFASRGDAIARCTLAGARPRFQVVRPPFEVRDFELRGAKVE